MRTVLDTNVFVSSFFGGKPRAVVRLWQRGEIEICVSKPILAEYVAVFGRMGLPAESVGRLLRCLESSRGVVFAGVLPPVRVCDDADDDKFVACALAAGAGCVVTGDRRLRAVGRYRGVEMRTSAEFLAWFAEGGPEG